MKTSEPQLYKVYYTKRFNNSCLIESDCEMVINRMHVYGIKNDDEHVEVEFKIIKFADGDRYIVPICDNYYGSFLLTGERLVRAQLVTIEPSDIINKIEHNDGGYTFVIEYGK